MKVLIADDSPVIRKAVSSIVTEAGYEAVTAADGIEAIQKFYDDRPDLLILDIQMPKMTGYMACRLLKDDLAVAHVPVLILTAHDSAGDRFWADKSGADGYLTKESIGAELLGAIKAATASRALADLMDDVGGHSQQLDQVDVLARVTDMLDRKLFEMTIINDIVSMATQAKDLRTTMRDAMFVLRRFVSYDAAAITIAGEKAVAVRLDRPVGPGDLEAIVTKSCGEFVSRSTSGIAQHEFVSWRCDSHDVSDSSKLPMGWRSMITVDLQLRAELIGTLTMACEVENAFPPQVAKTLRTVEDPLATVVDSAIQQQRAIEAEARRSLSTLYDEF